MGVFLSILNGFIVGMILSALLGFIEAWSKKAYTALIISAFVLIVFVSVSTIDGYLYTATTDWWYLASFIVGSIASNNVGEKMYNEAFKK